MTDNYFEDRYAKFLEGAQKIVSDYYAMRFPNLKPSVLSTSKGRRYVKVITTNNGGEGQRSVWAFIDKTNGDVLKPAGWAAPAKHARGNIYNSDNGLGNVSWTGPAYL